MSLAMSSGSGCSISDAASAGMRCCSPSTASMSRRFDGSLAGLAVVRETAATRGLPVSLHQGLADALPFPDAGFDYVLTWNVIHHGTLGDLGRRLGEIWRVLRPAGLLQVTVLSTRDANYGIGRA